MRSIKTMLLALGFSGVLLSPEGAHAQRDPETGAVEPVIIERAPTIILPPKAPPRAERFNAATDTLAPLTPEEIRQFRRLMDAKQDAMYGDKPPQTESRRYSVSLETGAALPVVDIAPGYVASLVFLDQFGQPWPIQGNPVVGNANLYQVSVNEGGMRNVLMVSALAAAGASNISVVLEDQALPINVQLLTNRRASVLRADMQVEAMGPNSNMALARGGAVPQTPDGVMMQFVDGVPPGGAEHVPTSDSAVRAWVFGGRLYVRTNRSVLSPSWESVSHGAAGLRVYRMQLTPMILYVDAGTTKTLRLDLPSMAARQARSQ